MMLRWLAKVSVPQRINNAKNVRKSISPMFPKCVRAFSSVPDPLPYDPLLVRNCAIIAHVDHGEYILLNLSCKVNTLSIKWRTQLLLEYTYIHILLEYIPSSFLWYYFVYLHVPNFIPIFIRLIMVVMLIPYRKNYVDG
jgi:hypothetical protein